jgi:hypothetical protein
MLYFHLMEGREEKDLKKREREITMWEEGSPGWICLAGCVMGCSW